MNLHRRRRRRSRSTGFGTRGTALTLFCSRQTSPMTCSQTGCAVGTIGSLRAMVLAPHLESRVCAVQAPPDPRGRVTAGLQTQHKRSSEAVSKCARTTQQWCTSPRLDRSSSGNTVLRMTTLTFKMADDEARNLRAAARRAKLTLSEFVRRRLRMSTVKMKPVGQIKCRHTGAMIFAQIGRAHV